MTDNKAVVQAAVASVYADRDPAGVARHFVPTLRQHGTLAADGLDGLQEFVAGLADDASVTMHRVLVDGDLVVTHGSYTGLGKCPLVGFESGVCRTASSRSTGTGSSRLSPRPRLAARRLTGRPR